MADNAERAELILLINSARSVLSAMGIVRMSYSSINSARSALSAMGIVRMSDSSINSARSALSAMLITQNELN
jgi:hypothetical protein